MYITHFWDARHRRCNAVLEFNASMQDRGFSLHDFLLERFGAEVYAIQSELHTLLNGFTGLAGDDPSLDMVRPYGLVTSFFRTISNVDSRWARLPDTEVFVLTLPPPSRPDLKEGDDPVSKLLNLMTEVTDWDIHAATFREFHAQTMSGRGLLPVGLN
ncbi:hypothetical protein [Sutterella sp.]|uniref:hypothetical protein n=1 Tax=Sutterella sp. TaxID=1981025 RepID=UPI0026DEAFD9|nr:hypothetical protein [Sutterella sp.]MDO5532576.1 hypothetical protein [Sutterella sp.]